MRKVANETLLRRDSYSDLLQAVNGSVLIYCLIIFTMTLFFHIMVEYGRWSSIRMRDFHVVLQKSVLFAPYSRYSWKKRPQSSNRFRTGTSYSIMSLLGLSWKFLSLSILYRKYKKVSYNIYKFAVFYQKSQKIPIDNRTNFVEGEIRTADQSQGHKIRLRF